MSENHQEAAASHRPAAGVLSESLREALHVKEAICKKLSALPQECAAGGYADAIETLCAEYKAAPELPPEFSELLDKQFADALAAARRGESEAIERAARLEKVAADVDAILAADALATLKEVNALEKRIAEFPGSDLAARLQPLKERLEAEAAALDAVVAAAAKLTAELQELTAAEDIAPLHDRKPAIEAEFAQLANLPRQDYQRYQEAHRAASIRLAQHYETLDLARWESYTLKLDICAELEKMDKLADDELAKNANALRELRDKWKQLGSVPKEKSEEINSRYLELTRQVQHRIDEFFARKRQEQKVAAAEKIKLCELAEAEADSVNWQESSNKMRQWQAEWKALPRAGSKEGELFARFRAAADKFFNARKAVYDERDRRFQAAAERKNALIAEITPDADFRRIRQLREEYRAIGSAGKQEAAIFRTFNAAMDKYFADRKEAGNAKIARANELIAEIKTWCNDPGNDKGRVSAIREELRALSCRETRSAEQQALREYQQAFNALKTAEEEKRCSVSGDVTRRLAECYAQFKNGGALTVPDAVEFAGFSKLQSAANLLAQAVAGDAKAAVKLEKQIAAAMSERENICAQLEELAGTETSAAPALSLAEELQAAIMGNFGKDNERKSSPAADPRQLLNDFASAGLVPPEALAEFQRRVDAAEAVIFSKVK